MITSFRSRLYRVVEKMYNIRMEKSTDKDYYLISSLIKDLKYQGAEITSIIQDVHINYEVASHRKNKREGYYRDLFARLVKTYGH